MMPQGYFRSHQDARDSTLGLVHALNAENTEAGNDAQIIALMAITIEEEFECNVRGGCGHRWSTVKVRENVACDALRLNTALHLDLEEANVPEMEEVNGWECPACGEKRALTKSGRVREWPRVLMITHEGRMYDFEDKCAWAKEIHVTGRTGESFRYVLRSYVRRIGDDAGHYLAVIRTTDCWFMIGAIRRSCPSPSRRWLGRGQTSVQMRVT
jgi:ubiquitin C-terminal hydrolase